MKTSVLCSYKLCVYAAIPKLFISFSQVKLSINTVEKGQLWSRKNTSESLDWLWFLSAHLELFWYRNTLELDDPDWCLYGMTLVLCFRMLRLCRDPTTQLDSLTSCRKTPFWFFALCANSPWSPSLMDLQTLSEFLVVWKCTTTFYFMLWRSFLLHPYLQQFQRVSDYTNTAVINTVLITCFGLHAVISFCSCTQLTHRALSQPPQVNVPFSMLLCHL